MYGLKINELEIEVHHKKHPYDEERVIILDEFSDVSSLEAEKIVNYLYLEGFLDYANTSLEIIKKRY